MKPKKSFLLRMDPSLFEELQTWASQESRSLNRQIEYLLREAVRSRCETKAADSTRQRRSRSS